ncbi:PTS glucose transporter subunit IIA [Pediococcus pentosaceus]|nr:PTS glucose transporter subunit IIA [Pediococcus pentosaceus]
MFNFFRNKKSEEIYSPVDGKVISLAEVNDLVFSQKLIGDGFAVIPETNVVYSPCSGCVTSIFPTKHAIGITTENGLQVLVHMGIDTVSMKESPFELYVDKNTNIKFGDKLAKIDMEKITKYNKEIPIIVIVTNMDEVKEISEFTEEKLKCKESVIKVTLN